MWAVYLRSACVALLPQWATSPAAVSRAAVSRGCLARGCLARGCLARGYPPPRVYRGWPPCHARAGRVRQGSWAAILPVPPTIGGYGGEGLSLTPAGAGIGPFGSFDGRSIAW